MNELVRPRVRLKHTPKTTLDIERNECRWPVGQAPEQWRHLLCARPCASGKMYCDAHMKLAYQPLRPKRS